MYYSHLIVLSVAQTDQTLLPRDNAVIITTPLPPRSRPRPSSTLLLPNSSTLTDPPKLLITTRPPSLPIPDASCPIPHPTAFIIHLIGITILTRVLATSDKTRLVLLPTANNLQGLPRNKYHPQFHDDAEQNHG